MMLVLLVMLAVSGAAGTACDAGLFQVKLPNDPHWVPLAIHLGHQDPQNGARGDALRPQTPSWEHFGAQDPQNGALGL